MHIRCIGHRDACTRLQHKNNCNSMLQGFDGQGPALISAGVSWILASAMSSLLMLPGQIHSRLLCKLRNAALLGFANCGFEPVPILQPRDPPTVAMSRKVVSQLPRLLNQRYASGTDHAAWPAERIGIMLSDNQRKEHAALRVHRLTVCDLLQSPRSTHNGVWEGRQLFPVFEQTRTFRSYQPGTFRCCRSSRPFSTAVSWT